MIDAHTHIYVYTDALEALFAEWSMQVVVVNITGGQFFTSSMDDRWRQMLQLKERAPERYVLCTTFDAANVGAPDFAERTIARLRSDIDHGARLVKVWKDIGLTIRDAQGRFVQIDDRRFQPVWDFLAGEGIAVLSHIGEPRAAWLPLDPTSPHYGFYASHPEHHLYRRDDVPSWQSLMDARDRWIAANPRLTIIGAHLGSMAHDVGEVARRLDAYPNFFVDTAERFGDLFRQETEDVRAFFTRYHDRILYGSDVIMDTRDAVDIRAYDALLRSHTNYLGATGSLEVQDKLPEPVVTEALDLSETIVEDVLRGTALRILG